MGFLFKLLGGVLKRAILPALFASLGWYAGAKFGAPAPIMNAADQLFNWGGEQLEPVLSEENRETISQAAQDAGGYVIGTAEDTLSYLADLSATGSEDAAEKEGPAKPDPPAMSEDAAPKPSSPIGVADAITICKMQISNAPRGGDAEEIIAKADETASINGVRLLLMPATKACLSSGYGYRRGRLHKGVDYYSDTGGDVLAAGDGVIIEAVSRSDYGNMIVIDHGNGVYTRYAHLARFNAGVREGAPVSMGDVLGPIGNSGASSIVHLHYEVLTGDLAAVGSAFKLKTIDPFGL